LKGVKMPAFVFTDGRWLKYEVSLSLHSLLKSIITMKRKTSKTIRMQCSTRIVVEKLVRVKAHKRLQNGKVVRIKSHYRRY